MTDVKVQVRRIYDDPEPSDGARVLVDRLWARGVSKERAELTLWCRDVAPSTELRRWYDHDPAKFEEFARRYGDELKDSPGAEALQQLRELAAQGPVTLLTASKHPEISQGAVLRQILTSSE